MDTRHKVRGHEVEWRRGEERGRMSVGKRMERKK